MQPFGHYVLIVPDPEPGDSPDSPVVVASLFEDSELGFGTVKAVGPDVKRITA